MSGVRATESSETRRGYLDLDTHLELRRNLRAIQNRRRGVRATLFVKVPWRGYRIPHVPEPWQAPA